MRVTLHWLAAAVLASSFSSSASIAAPPKPALILADTTLLLSTGISIIDADPVTGVSLAEITPLDEIRLSYAAHVNGKCGGFERLAVQPWMTIAESRNLGQMELNKLRESTLKMNQLAPGLPGLIAKPQIASALDQVDESRLRDTVTWLSSFPTRFNKGSTPNQHVEQFRQKLEVLVSGTGLAAQIDLIAHQSTPQKSIRLRIPGKDHPEETVVLGAHLDSINQSWGETRAPGADDNASGSSNLLEALRILVGQGQPSRSVEFFWYAGEESGLLGSAEIAKDYASAGRQVVGVLQLDMTLFPGDGEFVLGSMTDFTSPALRRWFVDLNKTYIRARIVDDKCGYGCSDHASWHRQGYPTIMPFEASFDRMFPDLHTTRDVIDQRSSFKHSAMFSKIALAFAMELGGY
jgi:leucyl aminopeptidase